MQPQSYEYSDLVRVRQGLALTLAHLTLTRCPAATDHMIEVPHPSCAAAARAHVAMLRASGSYRHHLTLLSSHVCSLTRVKRTPSTSETAGGGEALGNAKEGGGDGASIGFVEDTTAI